MPQLLFQSLILVFIASFLVFTNAHSYDLNILEVDALPFNLWKFIPKARGTYMLYFASSKRDLFEEKKINITPYFGALELPNIIDEMTGRSNNELLAYAIKDQQLQPSLEMVKLEDGPGRFHKELALRYTSKSGRERAISIYTQERLFKAWTNMIRSKRAVKRCKDMLRSNRYSRPALSRFALENDSESDTLECHQDEQVDNVCTALASLPVGPSRTTHDQTSVRPFGRFLVAIIIVNKADGVTAWTMSNDQVNQMRFINFQGRRAKGTIRAFTA